MLLFNRYDYTRRIILVHAFTWFFLTIVTRSQTCQKIASVQLTHTATCTCSHSESVHTQTDSMNKEQQAFQAMFTEMYNNLREEMAKE